MAQVSLTPLAPKEAVAYFKKRGLQAGFAWQDVWQEEHARAFTVAKMMSASLLQDTFDSLSEALEEGLTYKAWAAGLRPRLEAQGWWGKSEMTDPFTGEVVNAQLGSPRRLRTIFDTNMRTAYASGRWQRIAETKEDLPYLEYQTVGDDRVRPEHEAWNGTILPVDDPWWDEHNPPCDWGCRCTVVQVSRGQLERSGKTGDERPAAFPARAYTNPRTGEVVRVEQGIGPGWGYNVGKAYLERETPSPMGAPDGEALDPGAGALIPRRQVDADQLLAEDVSRPAAQAAFLGGFGLAADKARVIADKSGADLVIGPGLFRNSVGRPVRLGRDVIRCLPLIGLALREPAEIRRTWRVGPDGQSLLTRRYFARFEAGTTPIDVVVDWANGGWWPGVSLDRSLDVSALRTGELVWSAA